MEKEHQHQFLQPVPFHHTTTTTTTTTNNNNNNNNNYDNNNKNETSIVLTNEHRNEHRDGHIVISLNSSPVATSFVWPSASLRPPAASASRVHGPDWTVRRFPCGWIIWRLWTPTPASLLFIGTVIMGE